MDDGSQPSSNDSLAQKYSVRSTKSSIFNQKLMKYKWCNIAYCQSKEKAVYICIHTVRVVTLPAEEI